MPQVYNLPDRIPESNYREAELLNRGLMENVLNTRQRLIARNDRATQIKRMMAISPELFGKDGATVDSYGNEDIDLNKLKDVNNSRLQGPSSSTIKNDVLVNPSSLLSQPDPNFDQSRNYVQKAQADIANTPFPNGTNSSISNTLALAGTAVKPNNSSLNTLQQSLVNQGILNQQQIMGQNQTPLTLPDPISVAGVLGNTGANSNLPLPANSNNQSSQLPLKASTAFKNSEGGGAGTTNSGNFSMSVSGGGYDGEGVLGTTTTIEKKTNMIDPVKKDINQLRTMAALYGNSFTGDVPDKNNPYAGMLKDKVDYLKELNKAIGEEGTFETQEREKFKIKKNDTNYAVRSGFMNSSTLNNNTTVSGTAAVTQSGSGQKDPNMEATTMSWLGGGQDPKKGQWSQFTTTKDGQYFIGNTTSTGKVFDTWKKGEDALGVLEQRISNSPYTVKDETTKGGNSKFVGYDQNGKAAGAIIWDREEGKWNAIGYDKGSTAVMMMLSGMLQNGFDMKELNQKAPEIDVRSNLLPK